MVCMHLERYTEAMCYFKAVVDEGPTEFVTAKDLEHAIETTIEKIGGSFTFSLKECLT
jgi:hypothetical protein